MNMPFIESQLKWVYFLQQIRGPIVDQLLYYINMADSITYTCSILAMIWIGFSWRWGCRLGYLMIISSLINEAIKAMLGLPRPFWFDPSLAIAQVGGFGFPSGGAQNAMLAGCLLVYYWKNRWAWAIGTSYALFLSLARIFLGVHFPFDILGGWAIAVLLFILFVRFHAVIEEQASRHPVKWAAVVLIACLIIGVEFSKMHVTFLVSALAIQTIGVFISVKYHLYIIPPVHLLKRFLLGFFAMTTAGGWAWLISLIGLPTACKAALSVTVSGLWISCLVSPICRKLFHLRRD
jgi:membrane-associated phospholipid phosphatase